MKRVIILVGIGAVVACNSGGSAAGSALPSVTMLSPDSANQQNARFSPDGKRAFWWEPAGTSNQLWTAGADLSNPTMVPVKAIGLNPIIWSPDGSQVAVPSSDSGLLQAAIIPAAGGAGRQVTKATGFAVPISWNKDGDRLAFISTAAGKGGGTVQTFVTSVSKGGFAPMVPGENAQYAGFWSPDGTRIAYGATDGSHNTIWVADGDGKNRRQLTTDGFEQFGANEHMWSPDGKWLAYQSTRTGTSDIWIVPVDSGEPRQLTKDIRNDYTPIWSPDGKWIAFMSDRGKQTDLWVVSAAGGTELRVTDDALSEEPMQWLSETRFAYLTGQGQSGIWAMNLADSSEKRLTPDSIRTGPPQLSFDGKQIAFRIDHSAESDLAVMPATGGAYRVLVHGGNNNNIVWSPDGSRIGFLSDRGGTNDVWVVDVAGGEPRQLDNWPGAEFRPTWSGDGSSIIFASDHDARITDLWKVSPTGGEPVRLTKQGSVQNPVTHPGRPELFASILDASGKFVAAAIKPDGSVSPVWAKNAFPLEMTATADSLVVLEAAKTGGFGSRLIAANGTGEGRSLLQPGEAYSGMSLDGSQFMYITNGSRPDIGMVDRKTGVARQLTHTPTSETGPVLTPDGRTVLFQRSRPIRRIAIADLTKLLAGAPK